MSAWTVALLDGSLGAHAARWDELNQRFYAGHPLLDSLFVNGLLRHFSDGKVYLAMCRVGGDIQAMCVLRRKNGLVWTSFLPSQAQVAATLVDDPALLDTLVQSLPGMAIQLDLLCNDPAFGAALRNAPRTNLLNHALTMNVMLDGSFEAYWASRSKQLQSNMKQRDKRLLDNGLATRMLQITDGAAMLAGVDRYAALECAGWKGRNGTAVGSIPAQHQFYRDLMLGAARHGDAMIFELWIDDQLAASRLVVRRGAMWVILKTSYDEGLAAYSPGRLLLRSVIRAAFEQNHGGTLEFYTDADQNQLEWASAQRWIVHRTLYRGALSAMAGSAMRLLRAGSANIDDLVVQTFASPLALPEDVQRFMTKAEKYNIGCGSAWYQNLAGTVFGDDRLVRFYVLRRGQQILAVLPLRAEPAGRGWRLAALSNFYTSLYEPVLEAGLKSSELATVLAAVQEEFPRIASLTMAPMDPQSHAYATLIGAIRIRGWAIFEYFAFGNWYQPVATDWKSYFSERCGTLQNTVRRMHRKFAADGGTLEIVTSPKAVAAAVASYERVYAASWKKPEPFPAFVPGLMQTYAAKGFLRLGLAWLNGEPVAAQIWIVAHGRAEIYKLAYDERFRAYSPGTLLTAKLMELAIDTDKVTEIDYLIGDDGYKKTWMSHRRERWGIVAYNPGNLRGQAGLAREAAREAAKKIRNRFRASMKRDGGEPPSRP